MGKAARWLRGLFRMKRPDPKPDPDPGPNKPVKDRRRNKWSFVKSYREKSNSVHSTTTTAAAASTSSCVGPTEGVDDASKHAIAVAEAAAVVRLNSSGKCNGMSTMQVSYYCGDAQRDVCAALVIQSCFRSYLARRALRALKGLVKLQALVRGHIMRKKTKETMLCMQALLRAQARARSFRTCLPDSPYCSSKSSQNRHPGPQTPEKFEPVHAKHAKLDQTPKIRRNGSRISWSNIADKGNSCSSNWSDPRMDEPPTWDHLRSPTDDERHDRILEVNPGKPLFNIRRRNLFESSHSGVLTSNHITHSYTTTTTTTSKDSTHQTNPSPVSCQVVQSLNPLKFAQRTEDGSYCTAENSPRLHSAGSQRGPFTPAKSDGSRSFLSGCSDCPSYMAYTESAKAKMRSHSAPKQRPLQYEKASSTKRHTVHGSGFTGKAYPGSGRLDRFGMPVRDSTVVYYSGYLN